MRRSIRAMTPASVVNVCWKMCMFLSRHTQYMIQCSKSLITAGNPEDETT
ncbi:hypothetical protein F2Q68_00041237 [Brassica cretica]|uniref:Uncharacterized protein n=2 Tax=Brassica cretica TaxID=69181 RepID=A0A8S9MFV8_BRACR|nr:hypothetical protein F2Q68_00041237 [Brassica cretica]KAF3498519.1 hypothetical protein DY000_02055680 [Brassica cretica]